ncbi:MAG: tetratricopeptide repeat protein [Planctomycetota bacterium]|jgi:non-specific serine/threonine protein kinase/serine/threonine-protein kinase
MSVEQIKDAETIFSELADLPATDRETILTERCGGDEQLRDFVKQLLMEHDRGLGEFMQAPPADVVEAELEPTGRVGSYRLVKKLGEGGFGEVHLAEQTEPIRRTVALKIVKLGMDTKQVVARFEAERQALALMDHPHIARVFEAGVTEHGRPYFAMEHVPGVPVTDYCDRHRLGMEQRLELFIHVCAAIQHAHQKGIIHRDLKPSNILIERFGEEHVPKVIDFGIAKAMGFHLTERTPVTEQGQLIGTPEYMSPEQAVMSPTNVDTRADIYSLGIVLYEMLAGAPPFGPQTFRGRAFNEIQRIIREVDPPRPSTRLSTVDGEATDGTESSVEAIATHRGTEPRTLQRRLRGDLDWIIMKAIDKDREHRYASVSELAADLRHHLRHEPVLAGPPTAVYRLRKLIRRHRIGVAAATAVVLVLIGGTAATTWQAVRATDAERLAEDRLLETEDAYAVAEREAATARAVNEFLNNDLLAAVAPGAQGRDVTMREVLDAAAESIEGRFEGEPVVESSIRSTLGTTYRNLGQHREAEPHLQRALELQRAELGNNHPHTVESMNALAVLYGEQARFGEAEPLFAEALERRRQTLGDEHPDTLESMNNLAFLRLIQGRYDEAEALQVDVLRTIRRVRGEEHPNTLMAKTNLARLYHRQGRDDEAEPLFVQAFETYRRVLGEEHPQTLAAMGSLASLYWSQGRLQEAEPLHVQEVQIRRRVLGEAHPSTLVSVNNLATLYGDQGRYEQAEALLVEALDLARGTLDKDHPDVLKIVENLAMVYRDQVRYDEAEPLFLEALEAHRRILGPEHPSTLISQENLGGLYLTQGRYDEAEPLLEEMLELRRRTLGDAHPETLLGINNLAWLYRDEGRYEEAALLHEEAIASARRVLPEGHYYHGVFGYHFGKTLTKLGRYVEADLALTEAYGMLSSSVGDDHPRTIDTAKALVELHEAWGKPEQAAEYQALLEEAQGVMAKD